MAILFNITIGSCFPLLPWNEMFKVQHSFQARLYSFNTYISDKIICLIKRLTKNQISCQLISDFVKT